MQIAFALACDANARGRCPAGNKHHGPSSNHSFPYFVSFRSSSELVTSTTSTSSADAHLLWSIDLRCCAHGAIQPQQCAGPPPPRARHSAICNLACICSNMTLCPSVWRPHASFADCPFFGRPRSRRSELCSSGSWTPTTWCVVWCNPTSHASEVMAPCYRVSAANETWVLPAAEAVLRREGRRC